MGILPVLAIGYLLTRGKGGAGGAKTAQKKAQASKAWPQANKTKTASRFASKAADATPQGRAAKFGARFARKHVKK